MPDYSGTELVPGKLRGYRIWRIPSSKRLVLKSTNATYEWEPGDNRATCDNIHIKYSAAPTPYCACGFYAKYKSNSPEFLGMAISSASSVIGVIDAWGKIQLGTKGFRAQYARIVAIAPFVPITIANRNTTKFIAESYGVEFYERVEYLTEVYPAPDMSDLLPKEPKTLYNITDIIATNQPSGQGITVPPGFFNDNQSYHIHTTGIPYHVAWNLDTQ